MKLADLEATFIGEYHQSIGAHDSTHFRELGDNPDGAQGILFVCPKCQNHSVVCWFANSRNAPNVPPEAFPRPGRWSFSGTSINDVSLSPSVDLSKIDAENPAHPSRCYWHGFVTNGDAS